MTAILNWIKGEWRDPSTHAWLVGLGATFTAWSNGAMTDKQALAAGLVSLAAIIVPTGAGK